MTREPATIEFWYDFPSPYSYLSALRIEALIARARPSQPIRLIWKPFLIGPILKRRTANPSPFQKASPAEQRYRRRDIERLCELYHLPLIWPSNYPRFSLLAARIALIGADEAWGPSFTRAVFTANFAEDQDIAATEVIAGILRRLGHEPKRLLARADLPETKAQLASQGEQAIGRGIFGAPSFLAEGELFWGNDRLEQAIDWVSGKRMPPA